MAYNNLVKLQMETPDGANNKIWRLQCDFCYAQSHCAQRTADDCYLVKHIACRVEDLEYKKVTDKSVAHIKKIVPYDDVNYMRLLVERAVRVYFDNVK